MSVSGVVPEPKDALRNRLAKAARDGYTEEVWRCHNAAMDPRTGETLGWRSAADAVLVELVAYLNEHQDEIVQVMAETEHTYWGGENRTPWEDLGIDVRGRMLVGCNRALSAAFGVVFPKKETEE